MIRLYYLDMMNTTTIIRFAFAKHTRYLFLGGGSGGVNVTSQLLRSGIHGSEIRVIDPAPNHYYQPGWTMVGAGLWQIHPTALPMQEVLPKEVKHTVDKVKLVRPEQNTVLCESGEEFTYD